MKPEEWGPSTWKFIHATTMEYPENPTDNDKRNYYNLFYNLQNVLPCQKCKLNYARHLEVLPLTPQVLSSRANLIRWGIDLHNIVNEDTGKPVLSYDQALEQFNSNLDPPQDHSDTIKIIIIIVIILAVIFAVYYFCFYNKEEQMGGTNITKIFY